MKKASRVFAWNAVLQPTKGGQPEDYQIWSLALKDVIAGSGPEEILIKEETVGPLGDYDLTALKDAGEDSMIAHNRDWPGFKAKLADEAISDFHTKNEKVDLLDDHFSLSTHETLIDRHTLAGLHERYPRPRDFWKALRGKYPKAMGLFGVSNIGFSSDRTLAVVYVYYTSGPIGGDGRYVLLRKVAGTWTFEARLMIWLS